jgi:hypothetical protein
VLKLGEQLLEVGVGADDDSLLRLVGGHGRNKRKCEHSKGGAHFFIFEKIIIA